MNGTLQEVFEITGRGVVVLVEIRDGLVLTGDTLSIGRMEWPITGIEMVNYGEEGRRRLAEGWVPPVGVLLKGATKADLVEQIGTEVKTLEQRKAAS
jgi:translation elongation factor EF-Tu-like GTPase